MQAKLVNQFLPFVRGAVAAEAIALADRIGLDLQRLGAVLGAGFGQSRMLERTLERVRSHNYDAGAALALYDKNLGLRGALGDQAGLQLPMATSAAAILRSAIDAGIGGRDIAVLHLRYPAARGIGSS
jgi:3-hydroxyisobutyrate dehydrogenase